jgi:glutathione S-transferase
MLTLYATPESLYSAKLRILLRHKQVRWQEIAPEGGCGSAEYRELIPAGTMPAIVDGDLVLADSEAIAEYLNETIAEPAMLPDDAVARARDAASARASTIPGSNPKCARYSPMSAKQPRLRKSSIGNR